MIKEMIFTAGSPTYDDHLGDIPRRQITVTFILVWIIILLTTKVRYGIKNGFLETTSIHIAHSIITATLSSLVVYFNDDRILSESIPLSFSIGYFIVDLIDCLHRRDKDFTIHAVLSLSLCLFGWKNDHLRQLHFATKGLICEGSTPFLYLWKDTREKSHFILFVVAFTILRPFWLFFLLKGVLSNIQTYGFVIAGITLAFYLLQISWFYALCSMLVNYKTKPTKPKSE